MTGVTPINILTWLSRFMCLTLTALLRDQPIRRVSILLLRGPSQDMTIPFIIPCRDLFIMDPTMKSSPVLNRDTIPI